MNDCPGPKRCHGCASWCDYCGDVDAVCDADVCFQHRCYSCNAMFTEEEFEYASQNGRPENCFACKVRIAMRVAMDRREMKAAQLEDDNALNQAHELGALEDEIEAGESELRRIDAWRKYGRTGSRCR